MKIALVVPGRFHAFDLGRALIGVGHDVTLLTNYPKWAAARFGFPAERVRSFWVHGVVARAAWPLRQHGLAVYPEAALSRTFGAWAARELAKDRWDVVHGWSGVAEETLRMHPARCHLIMRGSAHIRTQAQILADEEARTGAPQDKPSPWMIAREEREYDLANRIVTLSSFAYDTFRANGVPPDRLEKLTLGARLSAFSPDRRVVDARRARILSGAPLRILFVGALSFQKGFWDLHRIVSELAGPRFHFRLVGPLVPETAALVRDLASKAEVVGKQPQHLLPRWYADADVFVFPTIQDGFAVVLAQAHASALPILTTTNSSGPDLLRAGETGWVLPIRSADAFIDRLRWCDAHRDELADMVARCAADPQLRDWTDVAADFTRVCASMLS